MIYHLPGEQLPTPEQVFAGPLQSSEHYAGSSEHKVELDMQRNDDGCLLNDHISAPLIDALDRHDAGFQKKLTVSIQSARYIPLSERYSTCFFRVLLESGSDLK